jgi:hypothetical protein
MAFPPIESQKLRESTQKPKKYQKSPIYAAPPYEMFLRSRKCVKNLKKLKSRKIRGPTMVVA